MSEQEQVNVYKDRLKHVLLGSCESHYARDDFAELDYSEKRRFEKAIDRKWGLKLSPLDTMEVLAWRLYRQETNVTTSPR